jgi:NADH-quinone oxidoreductase subunit N
MFALLGMFVMISGSNFLLIYLGLELLTLSSYALVALRRDNAVASEAAMKYFVLGAMASGFLLYGLSMMYGATGSLDVNEVFKAIASGKVNHQVLVFGLVFIVAGLAFKVGAAPFHMWVPDVYQGAPTAVTLLIGAAPELAAFAHHHPPAGGRPAAAGDRLAADAGRAGHRLAAGRQPGRHCAEQPEAHAGLLDHLADGLHAAGPGGRRRTTGTYNAQYAYSASMFYIVTYVLTTLASFGIILLLAREGFESEEITDLAGLNQRSPLYAGVMAIAMFSLAGLPPLVGFYAKLAVLQALIASGQAIYIGLAVFAVMMSLIGAFYYLRVVKVMYFDAPVTATTVSAPRDVRTVLTINGALILILGIVPGGLMTLCYDAIVATLAH